MPDISIAGHLGGIIGGICSAFILPSFAEGKLFSLRQRLPILILYLGLASGILYLAFNK